MSTATIPFTIGILEIREGSWPTGFLTSVSVSTSRRLLKGIPRERYYGLWSSQNSWPGGAMEAYFGAQESVRRQATDFSCIQISQPVLARPSLRKVPSLLRGAMLMDFSSLV